MPPYDPASSVTSRSASVDYSWWHSDNMVRKLPFLKERQRLIATIRRFFEGREFLEVETPILQISPGLEPHLKAFKTVLEAPDGTERVMYLHTSPEFAMKKLLAAGTPRLFQMARTFRNGERSETHHPEFTLLEWYRSDADYRDLMDDVEALFTAIGLATSVERLTVQEAFIRYAQCDVLATVSDPFDRDPFPDLLRKEACQRGIFCGEDDRWEDIFFRIFLEKIEPYLGQTIPCILTDWPASMAALSRRSETDLRVCERFEVYYKGVELANAFSELTDPEEQRQRFMHDMDVKERLYGVRYPVDEDFLQAVAQLPRCAGIALGIDRLVMVATGAERIEDVLWAEVANL